MALTFADRNEKVVLHSWGRFRATLFVAVVTGDVLGLYSSTTSSLTLADDSSGPAAIAVACENIAAGGTGWCALAGEFKAPVSIGTGGVVTRTYFDDGSAKDIGQVLYLDEDGKVEDDIGTTTKQQCGYQIARDRILLVPGGMVTGAGAFSSISATSTVSFDSTLSVAGALTPTSSNTPALGSASKMWADLFLGEGAVINFNAGDVTLTHATGKLSLAVAVATPALADGYGFFEKNFNLTGQATGAAAGESTWLNLEATFLAKTGGGLVTPHTDGIYMVAGAAITGAAIALIGKFTDQMDQSNFTFYNLWNLNLTQTLTALIEVNNPALLGWTTGAPTGAEGSVPLFTTGGGAIRYVKTYSTPA